MRHHQDDHSGDERQLRADILTALPGQASNFACATLLAVMLGRWMKVEDFGAYAFAFHTVRILAMVSVLGLNQGALRLIPRYRKHGRHDTVCGFILWGTGITVIVAVVVALITYALTRFTLDAGSSHDALVQGLWLVPAMAMGLLLTGVLRSHGHILLSTIAQGGVRDLGAALIAWVMVSHAGGLDAEQGLVALGASIVLGLVLQGADLASTRMLAHARPEFAAREWLAASLPMAVATVSRLIAMGGSVILLRMMMGEREAGLFHAAMVLALAMLIPARGVMAGASPMLAHHADPGELPWFERFYRTALRVSLIGGVILAVPLAAGGQMLLGLFGPDFAEAYPILLVLIATMLFQNAAFVAVSTLYLAGGGRSAALPSVFSTTCGLVFAVGGIAAGGMIGAAFAYLASRVLLAGLALRLMRRHLRPA